MRERLALHQIGYISGFCLGLLEEFGPNRDIVKEVPHDYAGAVRSTDLLHIKADRFVRGKTVQWLVGGSDTGQ